MLQIQTPPTIEQVKQLAFQLSSQDLLTLVSEIQTEISVIQQDFDGVDAAPPELQAEFWRMQTLNVEALRSIAQAEVDTSQYERHVELLGKNEAGTLSDEERQELGGLRTAADQLMLRKAYAWSLLRKRGQQIPSLEELRLQA